MHNSFNQAIINPARTAPPNPTALIATFPAPLAAVLLLVPAVLVPLAIPVAVPAVIPLGILPSTKEAPHFEVIPLDRVEVWLEAVAVTRGVSWVMSP